MNRLFYTNGKKEILETEYNKPEITDNEIEVKSALVGVCRSDIDMYCGNFQLLPKEIQGHECVGIVTRVGKNISDVKEGDFVATRGEPGFADFYNCKPGMYVKVPSLEPKYIIEPIACALNIIYSMLAEGHFYNEKQNMLFLGSGFLSCVAANVLSEDLFDITVVGNANKPFWLSKKNVSRLDDLSQLSQKFKNVIDFSDKPEYVDSDIYEDNSVVVMAAEKHPKVHTNFSNHLWKSNKLIFPSPRNSSFHKCMEDAVHYATTYGMDNFWTAEYHRDTEIKQAFDDGLNRPVGYSRGYIRW